MQDTANMVVAGYMYTSMWHLKLKKKSYEDKNSKSSEVVAVQQKGPKSGN